jgi:gamma-glutamyltranspeptidase / glutathione hydrolase
MATHFTVLTWFYMLALSGCALISQQNQVTFVESEEIKDQEPRQARGLERMIAAQGAHSARAGEYIFSIGGNIVDATVAISFAQAVERPQSTGIGGGGFLMFLPAGATQPVIYDFREVAPLKGHSKMFLDSKGDQVPRSSIDGVLAAGVPGLVDGLVSIHQKYGKLPLATVMQPAIKLAREGFAVHPELARALVRRGNVLHSFESSRKIFFHDDGTILKEGDLIVQKDLAATLERISLAGKKGFYQGPVAQAILKTMKEHNGLMTQKDLDQYATKMRPALRGTFKGYEIFSMPPPSSGGIHIIQILNLLEAYDLKAYGPHHSKSLHLLASAMQQAFSDRAVHLGDTDFVSVPLMELTSKKYANLVRKDWVMNEARRPEEVAPLDIHAFKDHFPKVLMQESDETVHFTLADKEGNVITTTQTINGYFGSALVVEGTGILLNNEMNDFTTKLGDANIFGAIGGEKNQVEPGKRPLSSMSPTLVMTAGKPVMALGSPAGTRILTCVAQTLFNYLEHDLPLYESVSAVRIHHQWSPDEIRVEARGLSDRTVVELKKMGHELNFQDFGCRVQAVAFEGEELIGVSDPRGAGLAIGL